jgi:hypothetical protein
MIKNLRNILVTILLFSAINGNAQETRADIEKKADAYFQADDYQNALPLYLRLLSLEPRNHSFNFRYGASLLMTSENKQDAFQYLKFAITSSEIEHEAFYFLGKAYHLQYDFKNAIQYYEMYKQKAGNRAAKRLDVQRQIEMCRNGKKLLSNNTDIIVLSKKSTTRDNFFRSYDFTNIGGQILVTEMFQSKQDKRLSHVPIIHFPDDAKQIFYASYADKADQKDIYTRIRDKNGKWSDEMLVGGNINTPFDDDYPFFHASSSFLYFSSKGHNSMGGYDLFRCKYDPLKNICDQVENLDFPLSSTDDDLLYIADSLGERAFMASTRQSPAGRIHVYDISVERVPMQMVVVKGTFKSEIDAAGKGNLSITIRDPNNGNVISAVQTSAQGDYLLSFPNAGKYEMEVVQKDRNNQLKEIIQIPRQNQFAPIAQLITEKLENEKPILVIENRFNEVVRDEELLAELARNRAKLEVNKQHFDLDKIAAQQEKSAVLKALGLDNFQNQEIKDLLISQFDKAVERNENLQKRLNQSKNSVIQLNEDNKSLEAEVDAILSTAAKETDPKLKRKLLLTAEEKTNQIRANDKILSQSLLIIEKLNEMEDSTKELVKKTGKAKALAEKVAVNDQEAFAKMLIENQDLLKELIEQKIAIDPVFEWQEEIAENVRKMNSKQTQLENLSKQKKSLDEEIAGLKSRMETAKKKELEALEMQLLSLEQTQQDLEREIAFQQRTLADLEKTTIDEITLTSIQNSKTTQPEASINSKEITSAQKERTENIRKIEDIIAQSDEQPSDEISETTTRSDETIDRSEEKVEPSPTENKDLINFEKELEAISKALSTDTDITRQIELLEALNQRINESQTIDETAKDALRAELAQIKNDFSAMAQSELAETKQTDNDFNNPENTITEEEKQAQLYQQKATIEQKNFAEKLTTTKTAANNGSLSKQDALIQLRKIQGELQADLKDVESAIQQQEEIDEESRKWVIELGETLNEIGAAMDQLEDELEEETKAIQEVIANIDPSFEAEILRIQEDIRKGEKADSDLKNRLVSYKERLEAAQTVIQEKITNNPRDWKSKATEQLLNNEIQNVSERIAQIKTDPAFIAKEANKKEVNDLKTTLEDLNNFRLSPANELAQRTSLQQKLEQQLEAISNDEKWNVFSESEKQELTNELKAAIAENQAKIDNINQPDTKEIATTDQTLETTDLSDNTETDVKTEQNKTEQNNEELPTIRPSASEKWSQEELNIFKNLRIDQQQLELPSENASKSEFIRYQNDLKLINEKLSMELRNAESPTSDLLRNIIAKNEKNLRKAAISIADLEQNEILAIATERQNTNEEVLNTILLNQNEIERVRDEKSVISAIPENERTNRQSKQLQKLNKEEAKIQNNINQQKARLLDEQIATIEEEITDNMELRNNANIQERTAAIAIKQLAAQQSKDIEKKSAIGKSLNAEKAAYIQALTAAKQDEKFNQKITAIQNEIGYQENNNSIRAQSRKQEQVNALRTNLRQNEQQLLELEKLRTTAKRRDQRKIDALMTDLELQNEELNNNLKAAEAELKNIANHRAQTKEKGVPAEAILNTLSFEEELEMAQSETYKTLLNDRNKLLQKQYEWRLKEAQLMELESELKQLQNLFKEEQDESITSSMQTVLEQISKLNSTISELETEIQTIQESIASQLPSDPKAAAIIANLLVREVDPIQKAPVFRPTTSAIPIGVAFKQANDAPTYNDENPIPIEPTNMDGLVYRVQIGAFSRPVPNETFNEFAPISGEEVRPGLIRYMAGYFPSRADATVARNQIRNLGYSDAFLVAYCNGERIPIYRAQQLQEAGLCVPAIQSSADGWVVLNETETDDDTNLEINQFAYNQAPGAAPATAVETKMGLFFTVQVGVYNKPIKAEQLYNIEPLMTRRLDNGQIRYSTGMFDNVEEAQIKRKYAVDKGVKDAFIVAYYKGERITVKQAQELLAQFGEEILESTAPTVVERNNVLAPANRPSPPPPVPFLNNKETLVRLVSKETYVAFPFQRINRLNEEGALFFYDANAQRIYSQLIPSETLKSKHQEKLQEFDTQQFYEGRKVLDLNAVHPMNAVENSAASIWQVVLTVETSSTSHRLMNYFQHSQGLKKMNFNNEGKLLLVWYEKTEDDAQQRLIALQQLGYEAAMKAHPPINWNK